MVKLRYYIFLLLCSLCIKSVHSQTITNYFDATVGTGKQQVSISMSFVHGWRIGKKQKIGIGVGGRSTLYSGEEQYYITAPARLTSGSTSPFIIFQDNITSNIDSFKINSPALGMINLSLDFDYRVHKRLWVGFNIDLIGFSFGPKQAGTYINGSASKIATALPTSFNLLLVSDNDRGSLNSEFYLRYSFYEKWNLKAGLQFLFTEYTTATNVQQLPEPNDRFRNKSLLLMFGVGYRL